MEITCIPFVRTVGIKQDREGNLVLEFDESILNHIGTIHAGALYTLAETASGDALKAYFPELVGKAVPLLRDSKVKFKKPAEGTVVAAACLSEDGVSRFRRQMGKKGYARIEIEVEVKSSDNSIVCAAIFNWFVRLVKE